MSQPRFLANHDLNEHIIAGVLRQEPAVEFVRVRDLGMNDRSDEEILAYAQNEGLLVVSHDVNTMPAAAYARLTAGRSFLRQSSWGLSPRFDHAGGRENRNRNMAR